MFPDGLGEFNEFGVKLFAADGTGFPFTLAAIEDCSSFEAVIPKFPFRRGALFDLRKKGIGPWCTPKGSRIVFDLEKIVEHGLCLI